MTHFRPDNTDGYSDADLAALNAAFDKILSAHENSLSFEPEEMKSIVDRLAEKLLAEYDGGLRDEELVSGSR